jgi:cytidylate kinase
VPPGFVIAVDGPSGAGKSTASRGLARRLGFRYVDTGAMYRGVAYVASLQAIPPGDAERLAALAGSLRFEFEELADGTVQVLAGGRDVTREIRRPEIGELASAVSTHPGVRDHLVRAQRAMAAGTDLVMEGRDIGTVVFPDAPVKFFITADPAARAQRRQRELEQRGLAADVTRVQTEQAERDARDSSRAHAPLRRAADAVVLDTTALTPEEVVEAMERVVLARRRGV